MSTLKERQTLIGQMAQAMGKSVYNEVEPKLKEIAPRMELQRKSPKLVTLEEAITFTLLLQVCRTFMLRSSTI